MTSPYDDGWLLDNLADEIKFNDPRTKTIATLDLETGEVLDLEYDEEFLKEEEQAYRRQQELRNEQERRDREALLLFHDHD